MSLPSDFDIARPSASSVQPCVAHSRYGAAPLGPRRSAASYETSHDTDRHLRYTYPKARAGRCVRVSTARWLDPESNHTSRMSVSLRKDDAAAFRALAVRAHQFGRGLRIPDVGGMFPEHRHDAVQHAFVGEGLAATLAIEDVIGTPQTRWREMHQSGRVAIMFAMRSSPQAGCHLTALNRVERVRPKLIRDPCR